jgi:hypothetical protein
MSYTLTGQPLAYDPKSVRRIVLYALATDLGLPPAVGYETVMKARCYSFGLEMAYDFKAMVQPMASPVYPGGQEPRIDPPGTPRRPAAPAGEAPVCVYYVAYNPRMERPEWVVAPMLVKEFCENMREFAIAAQHFYGISGHAAKPKVKLTRMFDALMRGESKEAAKSFGAVWLTALQDPEWWLGMAAGQNLGGNNSRKLNLRNAQFEMARRRAMQTRFAKNYTVNRSIRVLDKPEKFWHIVGFKDPSPELLLGGIMRERGLRMSKNVAAGADYGVGAYAWGQRPSVRASDRFIEFYVPAGTAVELIDAPTGAFYRLVPAEGDIVPIQITGHNFTEYELQIAQFAAQP